MNPTAPGLLTLPRELRDLIWTFTFSNEHVCPGSSAFDVPIQCQTCRETLPKQPAIIPHTQAIRPLFTNRQIYTEARSIYYETLTVHVSSYSTLNDLRTLRRRRQQNQQQHQQQQQPSKAVHNLTLHVHLNDESRYHWLPELGFLAATFPSLTRLTVNNHMRAPSNYDRLIDAIYLLGPLITLPHRIRPSSERARFVVGKGSNAPVDATDGFLPGEVGHGAAVNGSGTSTSDGGNDNGNGDGDGHALSSMTQSTIQPPTPSSQQQPNVQASTNEQTTSSSSTTTSSSSSFSAPSSSSSSSNYKSEDLNPNFTINFAYLRDEILFETPLIGTISTSDALHEHEAVLRDCLASPEFRHTAEMRDLNGMTVSLLTIARDHEQGWLEGLHRFRMGGGDHHQQQQEHHGDIGDDNDDADLDLSNGMDSSGDDGDYEWGVDNRAGDVSESTTDGNGGNAGMEFFFDGV